MHPGAFTAYRLRATPKADPYSGEETGLDWHSPDRLELDWVLFAPGSSAEQDVVATQDIDTFVGRLYLRDNVDPDITPSDRIEVNGEVWAVKGHPMQWHGGLSRGSVVVIERLRGSM